MTTENGARPTSGVATPGTMRRVTGTLSHTDEKNISVRDICPSCGYPKEHLADRYCDLCRKASRDENDREAKTIRNRTWNGAIRREHVHLKGTSDLLVVPFEKVQEALARTWSEFAATEDFRNRMALAQEIELLNVEGGI